MKLWGETPNPAGLGPRTTMTPGAGTQRKSHVSKEVICKPWIIDLRPACCTLTFLGLLPFKSGIKFQLFKSKDQTKTTIKQTSTKLPKQKQENNLNLRNTPITQFLGDWDMRTMASLGYRVRPAWWHSENLSHDKTWKNLSWQFNIYLSLLTIYLPFKACCCCLRHCGALDLEPAMEPDLPQTLRGLCLLGAELMCHCAWAKGTFFFFFCFLR